MYALSGSHRIALLFQVEAGSLQMSQDRWRKQDTESVSELQSCENLRFLWRSHIISVKNICKDGRVSEFFWRGF